MGQPRLKSNASGYALKQAATPKTAPQKTLTHTLWQIDWEKYLPLNGTSQVKVHLSDLNEVGTFVASHLELVYGRNPENIPFLIKGNSQTRFQYYQEAGDFFAFKDGEKLIGFFVGNSLDWETYYWRSVAILPEYQGRGIYQAFLDFLLGCLASHGVKRIEADISPANFESIHVLNKLHFHITGFQASERWGGLVHFTKFLEEKHLNVFEKQFCCGSGGKKQTFPTGRKRS